MAEKKLPTNLITPEIICSYPNLFEVSSFSNKYGMSIPIPKTEEAFINQVSQRIGNAAENKWGKKARTEIGKKIESPLRDGDDEKPDDPVYKGTIFFSANTDEPPGLVDRAVNPIMDRDEIYAGCIVRASINFYGYDHKGKKGIACGLNNVQKVKDSERIGGRSRAEDDFAAYADTSYTSGAEPDEGDVF